MVRKYERDRLEAFDMSTWRNMENISCKDHKTNLYVLVQVKNKRKLSNTILQIRDKTI